jgi:GT2 family glycosyltransferase
MSARIDLSIVIVTWRSLDYLGACLASIYSTTKDLTHEIIVVDNASGDDCERVIHAEFPEVLFIASQHNLGFAKANNLGFRHSSGETLLFLNPDTVVRDNVFARMVAHLRTNASAGAAGARLLNSDGTLQTSCVQAYPTIVNQVLDSGLLRRLLPNWSIWGMKALFESGKQPCKVDAVSGACIMVKRDVFREVGGFTESYLMYVEDLDLCYKIALAGYRVLYLPDCEVVHHGGRSSTQQSIYFVNLQQRDALAQFFRSTKSRRYSCCYRAVTGAAASMRMMLVILSIPLGPLILRGATRRQLLGKWFAVFRWAVGVSPESSTSDVGISAGKSPESASEESQ